MQPLSNKNAVSKSAIGVVAGTIGLAVFYLLVLF